jgi:hypothetical protein
MTLVNGIFLILQLDFLFQCASIAPAQISAEIVEILYHRKSPEAA